MRVSAVVSVDSLKESRMTLQKNLEGSRMLSKKLEIVRVERDEVQRFEESGGEEVDEPEDEDRDDEEDRH